MFENDHEIVSAYKPLQRPKKHRKCLSTSSSGTAVSISRLSRRTDQCSTAAAALGSWADEMDELPTARESHRPSTDQAALTLL